MWNDEDGFYYDLDGKEKQLPDKTIASYWPLLAEIPNEDRERALIAHLSDPRRVRRRESLPDRWRERQAVRPAGRRLPRLRVPAAHLHGDQGTGEVQAVRAGARESPSATSTTSWTRCTPTGKTGTSGRPTSPSTKGRPTGRATTGSRGACFCPTPALSTIALMIENVVGLYISLPRKTVDWIIPTLEIMGIENLALKRNTDHDPAQQERHAAGRSTWRARSSTTSRSTF